MDRDRKETIRVGGLQLAPVWLNKKATIEKVGLSLWLERGLGELLLLLL